MIHGMLTCKMPHHHKGDSIWSALNGSMIEKQVICYLFLEIYRFDMLKIIGNGFVLKCLNLF